MHNLPKSVNKIYDGKEKIIDAVDQLLDNNFKTYENPLGFELDSLNQKIVSKKLLRNNNMSKNREVFKS